MEFLDWLGNFLHGILQHILLWAPIVEPLQEPLTPYDWFKPCEIWAFWAEFLDENRRPTDSFMDFYWQCIWSQFTGIVVRRAIEYTDRVIGGILDVLGIMPDPYVSVAEWLAAIWGKIGFELPPWATSIIDGLEALWNLLPEEIRTFTQTWSEIWDHIAEVVQGWVSERYNAARQFAIDLWEWYVDLGLSLTKWWQWSEAVLSELVEDVYGFLTRYLGKTWDWLVWFWSNPYLAVAGWLDPWWSSLLTFAQDCLDYWYDIWGNYSRDLADFLEDPLEFLWNRGEAWLNRRLEQP